MPQEERFRCRLRVLVARHGAERGRLLQERLQKGIVELRKVEGPNAIIRGGRDRCCRLPKDGSRGARIFAGSKKTRCAGIKEIEQGIAR
jgi:hypothetical protein